MLYVAVLCLVGMTADSFAYEPCTTEYTGPIKANLEDFENNQPLFTNFVTNLGASPELVSVCFTLYRTISPGNHQIYKSRVFTNKREVISLIGTELTCGRFGSGNPNLTEVVTTVGYLEDCRTYILCTNVLYGPEPSYCFGMSPDNKYITKECLDAAFKILHRNGHPVLRHVTINSTDISTCVLEQSCSVAGN